MHLDSTLRRVSRAAGNEIGTAGRGPVGVAFVLAISLAGCVGEIDTGKPSEGGSSSVKPPSSGGGGGGNPGPTEVAGPSACKEDQIGFSPLRRLTRTEYDNSIKDLLGVDLGLSQHFSEDEFAGSFPGNYFTPISESQYGQYASAAASAAFKTIERINQLLPCAAGLQTAGEASCATQFIRQFGRRAYRRPLADDEVARYEALFKMGRTSGDFATGITLVTEGMLESPHFLYLVEGPGPLTQHQLAARLSYFLWNAPPDAKLSTLADTGGLRTPEALRTEAKRMLGDPRAQEMIDDFHLRWLGLTKLEILQKDEMKFPEFAALHPLMREELTRFTGYVMGQQGDGKLETLLTAPFTFANSALAKLYDAKTTGDWQKVDLDPGKRAGVLTQSAFLATHGHEGSAPIFRGVAVREQLLCMELPPPPPGADALFPPPSPTKTTRERLQMHRVNPECASCHDMMDTLGYAFESFDDIGRYRTTENGVNIDDTGAIVGSDDADGPFKGPVELGKRLAKSKHVQQCVTTQWFRYAMGRNETGLDKCTMDMVFKRFKDSEFRVPELLLALVESDGFRIRRAEENGK
jgi:hypothetical protein